MAQGGISASGRVLRWVLWRAPKRAAAYTLTSNMNLASDIGRRWIVWLVFGAYLWGMRWLAEHVVRTRVTLAVSAVLLLLWLWHAINLFRWSIHARATAARARALQRQQFEMIKQLPGQVREQVVSMAGHLPTGGLYTVAGMGRQHDPEYAAQQQRAREQLDEVRGWLPPEQQHMDLGDRYEPVWRMPKWIRKRRPR